QHADPETLTTLPDWLYNRYEEYSKRGDAELAILSSNPDLYNGIDSDRIAITRKTLYQKIVEPLRKYNNYANWCVVSTAAPAWAQKVFPNLPEKEAQTKLWDAIFRACRIHTPDPVKAWEEHIQKLDKYKNYLNAKRFASLRYKAPGTDLTIGLPEDHHWGGAQETFKNGITGTVNIPTEEVFTMPHKNKVDGLVTATLPLNNQGVLMEEFSIRFENGRAVNFSAKKGDADLRKLIETDENAGRLGEVALVPNSSPISQSGILFYNTLFDENASCHLALGSAYKSSMQGGVDMTDEEFAARGGNKSLIHVDFMIGSAKMDIDGIQADGTREPLMRNGEWAFSV
ncbi:MAG TPA: aminopeptidase, partial [Anaerolineales bacterium]|nr:aminopeptidase [Anaerolineales bacterium]